MHKVDLKKGESSLSLKFANLFGIFGYMFTLFVWIWVGGLTLYPIFTSGTLDYLLPNNPPVQDTPIIPQPDIPQGIAIAVGIIVTIICCGIMVYALYIMPKAIGKTGAKLTQSTAKIIVPAITQNQKVSKKQKKLLTFQISAGLKIILAVLPVLVAYIIPDFTALHKDIVLATALIFSALALFNFGLQITIAKAYQLNTEAVW